MNITAKIVIDQDCIMDNISSLDQAYLLEAIYEGCSDDAKAYFVKKYIDDDLILESCKDRIKNDDGCFADSCKNAKIHITLKS